MKNFLQTYIVELFKVHKLYIQVKVKYSERIYTIKTRSTLKWLKYSTLHHYYKMGMYWVYYTIIFKVKGKNAKLREQCILKYVECV